MYCPVMSRLRLRAIPTDRCRAVPRVVAGAEGIAGRGSAGEGESVGTAIASWGSAVDVRGSGAGLAGGGGGGGGGGEGEAAPCMCSPCLSLKVHAEASRDMTALLEALHSLCRVGWAIYHSCPATRQGEKGQLALKRSRCQQRRP